MRTRKGHSAQTESNSNAVNAEGACHYSNVQMETQDGHQVSKGPSKSLAAYDERIIYNLQQHTSRVFDVFLDLHQELYSLPAIKKTMVISQGKIHHGAYDDLTVDNHWLVLDSMQTQNSGLRKVDNWSAHQGTKHSAIADSESAASHILNRELAITSLVIESVNLYRIEIALAYLLA
jgi:hypothetical protein